MNSPNLRRKNFDLILAAIDIGSNAGRLLISEVKEDSKGKPLFQKLELIRIPLRLGFDVFESQRIADEKRFMFLETMIAFRHLMNGFRVEHYLAYATSAMRDAVNAPEIIREIKEKANIKLEVISGDLEANLIYENHVAEGMGKDHSYLYIDVGGGSTELSFFSNDILIFKKSFNIGTIRLLKDQVTPGEWDDMKNTIRAVTKGHQSVIAIGSGGNINKVYSLSKRKDGKSLPYEILRNYQKELSELSLQERMLKYDLKPDRADVIVPALNIYLAVMRWANAQEILVPKIGLADGLIQHLYAQLKK